ncbi:hypothetical protein [Ancylobacter terrae]|uniref:hypothetical protein n=1 Tax=Ancylobacter sp. sgz301288 TaxID=3342077 RepID=UPI003859FD70
MGFAAAFPTPAAPVISPAETAARAALRGRADFSAIARRTAGELGQSYRANRLLARLLNDRARIVVALLMLDLHFEPADQPGLTVGRLQAEAGALGLCSPGRVTAILAAARLLGLVAPAPDSDGRRRRLAVTSRLIDIHRERWRAILAAAAPALPEAAIGLARLDEERFVAAFVAALLRPFRAGWRIGDEVPALRLFADRDGGLLVAFALYEAMPAGTPLPVARLARDFRLSRSHVTDILDKAAQSRLARRAEGAGFLAEPRLAEAMEAFIAIALVRQAFAVREAVAARAGSDA